MGVDGDLTYSKDKQEFVKKIPLDLLVLETDSPFLTPEPVRSSLENNEPKNLVYILEMIAKITGKSKENIKDITTANALELFGIK